MNPIISFRLDKPTRRRRIDWPFVGFAAFMGGLTLFFCWLGWQVFKWLVKMALIGG